MTGQLSTAQRNLLRTGAESLRCALNGNGVTDIAAHILVNMILDYLGTDLEAEQGTPDDINVPCAINEIADALVAAGDECDWEDDAGDDFARYVMPRYIDELRALAARLEQETAR